MLVFLVFLAHDLVGLDGGVQDGAVLGGLVPHGFGQRRRRRARPPLLELFSQLGI